MDPLSVEDGTEKCGKPAASFIPRWGMSFACVLNKDHEGECQQGGTCFKHGPYIGQQCSQWPICVAPSAELEAIRTKGVEDGTEELPTKEEVLAVIRKDCCDGQCGVIDSVEALFGRAVPVEERTLRKTCYCNEIWCPTCYPPVPTAKPIPEERTAEMEQLIRPRVKSLKKYGHFFAYYDVDEVDAYLDHIEGKAK